MSEGVEPMGIGEGPYTGKPNPHAWMSPNNALIYVENIRKALVQHDPANAETYDANAAAYSEQIKALDAPLRARLDSIPEEQRWLVTSEGAFSYLTRDYEHARALSLADQRRPAGDAAAGPQGHRPRAQEQDPRGVLREHGVGQPAKQVARETGAAYGGVLYVDSLSEADGPMPTYLDLLR